MRKQRRIYLKKIIASLLLIVFTGQPILAFAATTADPAADANHHPGVKQAGDVTVVDIATPNSAGLSHNFYTDFNVDAHGLVLNNAMQASNTTLAGQIQANANLKGMPASIILNEVTGSNRTNLQGMLEVGGTAASVIIANPNGITGNGFGFINANQVTLVTGKPEIDAAGNLESYQVSRGDVSIEGTGIAEDNPVTNLDILTRAAKINAQVWVNGNLNVVTGSNKIDAKTLATQEIPTTGSQPDVALDIGAVGGMYAGKIMLVGTEKGLGVNIDGRISADDHLNITSSGKIAVQGSMDAKNAIGLSAKDAFLNNGGQISSNKDITIQADSVKNTGFIAAGEVPEDDDATGTVPQAALADLTIQAAQKIESTGNLNASQNVTLSGTKVSYDVNNTQAKNIVVNQSDPDPKEPDPVTPVVPVEPVTPVTPVPTQPITSNIHPNAAQIAAIPDYAAVVTTKAANKEAALPIVADYTADYAYKPMLDKTASGIDLVQIATPNASGISRNLYTDFNVKSNGLIFNNATHYVNTELGGYIDYNTRLGGVSAKVILNEVTSANPSHINGFMEVAGNTASIVLANPNGITVNGSGYINTNTATLASARVRDWSNGTIDFSSQNQSDFSLQGDGLNAGRTNDVNIVAHNIVNDASELWGNGISLTATGDIVNTGKMVGQKDTKITGNNLTNEKNAVLSSQGNVEIHLAGDLNNQSAAIHSGKDMTLESSNLKNQETAAIYADGNQKIKVRANLNNDKSTISAQGQAAIEANTLDNTNQSLLYANGDLTVQTVGDVTNQGAAIQSNGQISLQADSVNNTEEAYMASQKNMQITAQHKVLNQNATIKAAGDLQVQVPVLTNQDGAVLSSEGNVQLQNAVQLTNKTSAVTAQKAMSITAGSMENSGQSILSSGDNLDVSTQTALENDASSVGAGGVLTANAASLNVTNGAVLRGDKAMKLTAGNLVNKNSLWKTSGDLTLQATNLLENDNAQLEAGGDTSLQAATISRFPIVTIPVYFRQEI